MAVTWDPYQALGVPKSASADDIRKAYRKLVKELHPDVRPNDKAAEDRFKRVSTAFALLSDPDKRARFDRGEIDAEGNERAPAFGGFGGAGGPFRRGPTQSGPRRGPQPGNGPGPGPGQGDFDLNDIFADLFGGAASPGARTGSGRDRRFTLDIDFVDAVAGARRTVDLGGQKVDIAIPAGIEDGKSLRVQGKGVPAGGGAPAGDAIIEVKVKSHPFFKKDGDNILMDLPISLTEAVQGGKVTVPTATGPVMVTIPPGSNTGATLRLKARGVGGKGDQLVSLRIVLPDPNDPELKAFLATWKGRETAPTRPQ
jgi:DnaJ-class molecular chaperone